jgi:pimeloyl-ACP methyl ester carboxylesterase
MPFCKVEKDVRIYYETFGSGSPIVFVHGGGVSHEFWEQQVFHFAATHQTVAIDLRGHGESDKPPTGHTFDRFTRDLEAVVRHLKLRKIALVCHAVGGYVGIKYALRNPNKVSHLVLCSSSARFLGDDPERGGFSTQFLRTMLDGLAKDKVKASWKLIEESFFLRDPGHETKLAILNIMLQWPLAALKMMAEDAKGIDFTKDLAKIRAPTLVIHGKHDRKQRFSGAKFLADGFPNGKLVVFENSMHLPPLEESDRFNRVLADFIKRK